MMLFAMVMYLLGVRLLNEDMTEEEAKVNQYGGLEAFAYFVFVIRTSFGDFDLDAIAKINPEGCEERDDCRTMTLVACWTFWTLIVVSNTVIFLNFLIAVISDVYE